MGLGGVEGKKWGEMAGRGEGRVRGGRRSEREVGGEFWSAAEGRGVARGRWRRSAVKRSEWGD